ncbi:hemolysin XhlA family protein [Gottfriedia sp. S16(2024)]|uniref:hemolysin XhlA family protein n=1 Tax=Gottfriedia sp. S16(2024) TaxID=3162883 RepID=UPI003D1DD9FB
MWIDEIKELQEKIAEIKERLAVAESTIVKIEQKIERIESNTSWTVRLIIGAIIMAVLRIILKGNILEIYYKRPYLY